MKLTFTTVMFLFFSSLLSAAEMPIHGNWCGPGHPPELETKVNSKKVLPITVDAIDAACKIHDFAYIERKPWGNSEADGNLAEAMTLILNKGTLWKYNPKPTLDDSDIGKFKKIDNFKITEREFLTAAAILAYMEKQQYINLFSDVLNGEISSILKIGTSSMVIATVPIAITNKLLSKLSKDLNGPEKSAVEASILAGELTVKFAIKASEITDKTIDKVGDVSEVVVQSIGKKTGLDKPVREVKEEVILLVTHPKKAVKKVAKKTVSTANTIVNHPKKAIKKLGKKLGL